MTRWLIPAGLCISTRKFGHSSLIAGIDRIKIVLVLSETVLVLDREQIRVRVRVTPVAEYEYENAVNSRILSF